MKNCFVFGLVAICAVLMASESTMAAFGGNGGGKKRSRACIVYHNNANAGTVVAWAMVVGADLPATLKKLKEESKWVEEQSIAKTKKLKNGDYVVRYGNASDFANLEIDEDQILTESDWAQINGFVNETIEVSLDGKDVVIDVYGHDDDDD